MNRTGMMLLLLAAMTSAGCESPLVPPRSTQDVYDFRLPTSPPSVLRWPSGATIRVFLASGTSPRSEEMIAAFEIGSTRWNAAARYNEYEIVRVQAITDADVVIRWSDESIFDFTGCEPQITIAVTTLCLDETDPSRLRVFPFLPPQTGSQVRIVVTVLSTEAGRPDRVERLVAHELGHVLGLTRHSLDPGDLMYVGTPARSTLSSRDSATVQVLYHTRAAITP